MSNFRFALAPIVIAAFAAMAHGQNLVVNGDFESGNVGFVSDYGYVAFAGTSTPQVTERRYTVGNIFPPSYSDWAPFQDHTTGQGNLLSANGAPSVSSAVWRQSIPVQPNTRYQIGFFLAEISTPASIANLDLRVGGVSLGSFSAPGVQDSWESHSLFWNSGSATTLDLSFADLNTAGSYNDFALDDISVRAASPVPEPSSFLAIGVGALALSRRRRRP